MLEDTFDDIELSAEYQVQLSELKVNLHNFL